MAKGGSKLRSQARNSRRTPVNTAAPWPDLEEAESRVLHIQAKLHRWATGDPDRRFDDLYNLVCDPAVERVASRTQSPSVSAGAGAGAQDPEGEREIPEAGDRDHTGPGGPGRPEAGARTDP